MHIHTWAWLVGVFKTLLLAIRPAINTAQSKQHEMQLTTESSRSQPKANPQTQLSKTHVAWSWVDNNNSSTACSKQVEDALLKKGQHTQRYINLAGVPKCTKCTFCQSIVLLQ